MTKHLFKCPCGKMPSELHISEGATLTYAFVSGNCCNEWMIEFRTDKHTPHSAESMNNALEAWNIASRY